MMNQEQQTPAPAEYNWLLSSYRLKATMLLDSVEVVISDTKKILSNPQLDGRDIIEQYTENLVVLVKDYREKLNLHKKFRNPSQTIVEFYTEMQDAFYSEERSFLQAKIDYYEQDLFPPDEPVCAE